jgi:toxin CptA
MTKSRRSSRACANPDDGACHLEWRPSRWLGAMLWALAALAPFSLVASGLPRGAASPLALVAFVRAVVDARRYRALPAQRWVIPPGRRVPTCDGVAVHGLRVGWRGPLAFLQWRDADGRRRRASLWPDTLDGGMRRELRIAMQRRDPAPGTPSMAG